jgi:hypothetical protein
MSILQLFETYGHAHEHTKIQFAHKHAHVIVYTKIMQYAHKDRNQRL